MLHPDVEQNITLVVITRWDTSQFRCAIHFKSSRDRMHHDTTPQRIRASQEKSPLSLFRPMLHHWLLEEKSGLRRYLFLSLNKIT